MVLDATLAGAAANSYLTVAEADALARDDLGTTAERWLAASVPDREKALIRATREIDLFVADAGGMRYSATQALLFPRAVDVTGTPALPFLHRSIRAAAYSQAAYVLENAKRIDQAASRRARGFLRFDENDGPSGELALDPAFGLLAPHVEGLLVAAFKRRVKLGTLRIRSSIEPAATVT